MYKVALDIVSLHDQTAIQWAKTNCTVESNQLRSEKHFYIKKIILFYFISLLDFIVHLLLFQAQTIWLTHMSGPHSCKRSAFTTVRESIKEKGRCEEKILGNLMTGKMIVLAKDFSEDWKKQQDWDQLSVG